MPLDKVIIKNLIIRNTIGFERWEREKEQPVVVNLWMDLDKRLTTDDSLSGSYNYGTISKEVMMIAQKTRFKSVEALGCCIAQHCIVSCGVSKLTVRVEKPTALLYAKSAGVEIMRDRSDFAQELNGGESRDFSAELYAAVLRKRTDRIFLTDILIRTIIGINPWEREGKQDILVNLSLMPEVHDFSTLEVEERMRHAGVSENSGIANSDEPITAAAHRNAAPMGSRSRSSSTGSLDKRLLPGECFDYRSVCKSVVKYVEQTDFKTVEALATCIAKVCLLESSGLREVTVRVEKPSALIFADSAGIEVTRSKKDFPEAMQS